MGVAGHVVAVGSGVESSWVGRPVVADVFGGYASRVVVPASGLVAVPSGVSLPDAAALLHDGRTAVRLPEVHPVAVGSRVLITGAGGALGLLLVQLAHAAGGQVIAAARDPRKRELAASLGATVVVDYSSPSWPSSVGKVDLVYDGVGGAIGRAALDLVTPGGHFSAHGGASGDFTPVAGARTDVTITGIDEVQLKGEDATRTVARALAAAAAGHLRPIIGRTYPLDRAAEAHAALENRTAVGKTLLLV
jgi:NADPH2:quinone reductase